MVVQGCIIPDLEGCFFSLHVEPFQFWLVEVIRQSAVGNVKYKHQPLGLGLDTHMAMHYCSRKTPSYAVSHFTSAWDNKTLHSCQAVKKSRLLWEQTLKNKEQEDTCKRKDSSNQNGFSTVFEQKKWIRANLYQRKGFLGFICCHYKVNVFLCHKTKYLLSTLF